MVPRSLWVPLLAFLLPAVILGGDFYVSPGGTPTGDGSAHASWDLATALAHPPGVLPGDTIWLRGGVYSGGFVSSLNGSPDNPITVRQYPGERATIDGRGSTDTTLLILGQWSNYWGFEVTNSDANRPDIQASRPTGVSVFGPNTKLINLVVHDAGVGVGTWSPAADSEIYGCLIYYNGNSRFEHGIYAQNRNGTKRIVDNLIFNNYGNGIQIHGTSDAYLNNFQLRGNASFNNAVLGPPRELSRNIILAGGAPVLNPSLSENLTYYPNPGSGNPASAQHFGGLGNVCVSPSIRDNYFVGSSYFENCSGDSDSISGNTFYGSLTGISATQFPRNEFVTQPPTGTRVFVRPNAYEPGRANIIVYNWDRQEGVEVDLTGVVPEGFAYEIRHVQSFFSRPVLQGVSNGRPVRLPVTGPAGEAPYGLTAPPTGPEFGAFVVVTTGPPPAEREAPTEGRTDVRVIRARP